MNLSILTFISGWVAITWPDVNRRSSSELPELHQLHVLGWSDHGHSGGALWAPQQGGSQDHHDGQSAKYRRDKLLIILMLRLVPVRQD